MYEWIITLDPLAQALLGLANMLVASLVLKYIKVDILRRALGLLPSIVSDVYAVYVKALKDSRSGGLTDGEKKRAKSLAVEKFKDTIFAPSLWAYLFGGPAKFDGVLSSLVEGALNKVKISNRVSEISGVNPTVAPVADTLPGK